MFPLPFAITLKKVTAFAIVGRAIALWKAIMKGLMLSPLRYKKSNNYCYSIRWKSNSFMESNRKKTNVSPGHAH